MPPNQSTHQIRTVPSSIEKGKVIDVDIETFTLSVVTEMTKKSFMGVPFATPYQHYANGEGIYFMPEVGSICWLCWPSDNPSRPFVIGWAPAREENGSLRSKKMQLNPGDIYLGTRDENFLILRRGGIVQVGGGPLCQRIFMPINNVINDYCENYGLHALGGDLEWTIVRPEATTDGKRPALLSLKAREFANDAAPIAVLEIGSSSGTVSENGSHKRDGKNILSLAIKESGAKGAATQISLEFRKDGSAEWSFKKSVKWTVAENLTIDVTKDLKMKAGTLARLEGANVEIEAKLGAVKVTSKTTIDLMAGASVNLGPQVNMGVAPGAGGAAGLKPVLLADQAFLAWLIGHRHMSTPPNTLTGPASADPLYAAVSANGHIAKKSKAQ